MMTRYATVLLLLLFAGSAAPLGASAQTTRYVATDGDDALGENDCTDPGNPCATIQNAVEQVGFEGEEIIDVAPGTYNEFDIVVDDKTLTIQGAGAATTIVDAQNSGRVLEVAGLSDVTLNDLTLRNGEDLDGGAIFVSGTLTANRCVFENNTAEVSEGGTDGGAIFGSFATIGISQSTFDSNTATGNGGAIFARSSDVIISSSTFIGNSAENGGAVGLDQDSDGGDATLTVNTFFNNSASLDGGGVWYREFSDRSITLQSNTFVGNSASNDGGAVFFDDIEGSAGTLEYANSIFADHSPNNFAQNGFGSGSLASLGYNLLDDATGDPTPAFTDQLNTTPRLEGLADNGGPTQSIRPLTSSPTLDAGNCSGDDQRGEFRPYDNPGLPNAPGGNGCDIGAVELQAGEFVPVTRYVSTTGEDDLNDCTDPGAPCATVEHAVSVSGPDDTIDMAGGTYTESGITLNKNLAITGAGAATTTLQAAAQPGSASDRLFFIVSGVSVNLSDLTLSNGVASGVDGGAILAESSTTLTVNRCVFRGNRAFDGEGGGSGGAIYAEGILSIEDSFFEDNQALDLAGGAVFGFNVNITASTFVGNSAMDGGAVFLEGVQGTQTLETSTFSQNTASNLGGAALFFGSGGEVTISSTTFTDNAASGSGGAIHFIRDMGGVVEYRSTIFDQNAPENLSVTDNISGPEPLQSLGFNVLSDASGDPTPPATDQFNIFADLEPLADNGGPTLTALPSSASPALDAGQCLGDTDQRGESRTVDFPLIPNAFIGCDVGAVELQEAEYDPLTRYVATSGDDAGGENDCSIESAPCATLANALSYAQDGETVRIAGGTYTEAGLLVESSVQLLGDGPEVTIVQAEAEPGTASDRVFSVPDGTIAVMRDFAVQHGVAVEGGGGGVFSLGRLLVENMVFRENEGSDGGAIEAPSGQANIVASLFEGNSATGSAGRGGALLLTDGVVEASAFVQNSATEGGGIAFNGDGEAFLSITNSTFSGNTASSAGGGVHFLSQGFSFLRLASTTLFQNDAPDAASVGFSGEGPQKTGQQGFIDLVNSIFAASGSNFPAAPGQVFASLGGNIFTDEPGFIFSGDQVDTDPLLLALADNGGPTPTHLPLGNSPAIDQGTCTDGALVDQRGEPRPFDDPDTPNFNEGCDVGSVELQGDEFGADLELTKTVDIAEPEPGEAVTFTLTVTNQGPLDASSIVVTDQLPEGLEFVSASPSEAFDPETGAWTVGSLSVGSSAELLLVVQGGEPGIFTNQAEIEQSSPFDTDSTPGNDSTEEDDDAEASVTVIAPAAEITPSVLQFGEVEVGASVEGTVTVTNAGTATLQVNEQSIAGPDQTSFSVGAGKGRPPVPPGESIEIPVSFIPKSGGEKVATLLIDTNAGVVTAGLRGVAVGSALVVAPTDLDFGDVAPGVVAEQALTVSNQGTGPLTVSSIATAGPDADLFTAPTAAELGEIAPGASTELTVAFQGSSPGTKEAALQIESDGGTATVALQARVLSRAIVVDPSALEFGPVELGAQAQASLSVRNDGEVPITLEAISVNGTAADDFTAAGEPGSLPPEASLQVAVTFTPSVEGARTATLTLAFAEETIQVPLSGQGERVEPPPPRAEVSPEVIDFGEVPLGVQETRDLTVQNTGEVPVDITDASVVGADASAFVLAEVPASVSVGASATISVTFTADAPGGRTATVELATSAGAFEVGVQAEVPEGPALVVAPDRIDFGEVFVGAAPQRTVQVANPGGTTLTLSGVSLAGSDAFAVVDAPETVSPGGAADLVVQFTPVATGPQQATLTIDALDAEDASVPLSGTGTRPALSVSVSPDPAQAGEPVSVSVNTPADFNPGSGQLFYRLGGATSFTSVPLGSQGDSFGATIPGSAVTERGVDYYVQLSEGPVTGTFPAEQADQAPVHLRVRVDVLTAQRALTATTYAIVAPAIVADDPSLETIFGGAYGLPYDPSTWRMLRWNPAQEDYDEFPDLPEFTPGNAFWLITDSGDPFEVGPGTSIDASTSATAAARAADARVAQEVTLAPGWNMIGGLYPFDVAWADVDAPPSVNAPQAWDPGVEDFVAGQTVLERERGYFVLNTASQSVTLTVPPVAVEGGAAKTDPSPPWASAEYSLQLIARLPSHGLIDRTNVVGLSPDAREGWDALDVGEPPPVGDHVRLSIVDGTGTTASERRAASLKPMTGEGQQWDLDLTVALPSERYVLRHEVTLQLVEHGVRPDGFQVYVLDRDRGVPLVASTSSVEGTVSLTLSSERPVARLRVLLGTKHYAEANNEGITLETVETLLEPPYPNPFNPETVIGYRLREPSEVILDIYDALGRHVRSLVAGEQPAGRHEVVWDARDDRGRAVASGIYFCRMQAGSYVATRTLTLVR